LSTASEVLPNNRYAEKPPSPVKGIILYWLPALVWLVLVGIFSSRQFAADVTQGLLVKTLRMLHVHVTYEQLLNLHFIIRKCAHFTVYGVLSGLFFRAIRGTRGMFAASVAARSTVRSAARSHRWKLSWAALALVVCLGAASADEFHQFFTPGRTGTWHDVVLDMMGATFVQVVILLVAGRRKTSR
jgi:VanZ family protein